MQIGKKDVIWNVAATFMRIASGVVVLPLVLRLLPTQEVGLWNIFIRIGTLAALLDFGFSNAFGRNITYIFSGVKELKAEGFNAVPDGDKSISYGLLKSVISAMRRYYGILTTIFLLIFFIISPFYLTRILADYHGNKQEIWISWFVYGILVAYQLYTYYYSSLLTGRGMIKRSLQIVIIGQGSRIVASVIFLLAGFGIISLVLGQLTSDIVNRYLSYRAFYDKETKLRLKEKSTISVKEVMKIMTPNSVKIGISTLGTFLVSQAVMFIAPLYLSLEVMASFGTTKQMIDIIVSLGGIWMGTYYPKITLYRVNNDTESVKRLYLKAKLNMIASFIICGLGLMIVGPFLLELIHSKTLLLPTSMIALFLLISFLDANHGMAITILLTKNEVPFVKAVFLSGIAVICLLFMGLKLTHLGIWGMILAPGIAQAAYQNWKWPLLVRLELKVRFSDYIAAFTSMLRPSNAQ